MGENSRLVGVESGLDAVESVAAPQGGEVRSAAALMSVRGTAGTLWTWSSCRTAARGHRGATLSPGLHTSRSTVSVSCTPPNEQQITVLFIDFSP